MRPVLRGSIRLGADSTDVTRELAVSDLFAWPTVLGPLLRREDLSEEQAGTAMGSILSGEATPAQIAAFATGLRIKGETAAEVTGLVKAMLAAAAPLAVPGPLLDTCGTGGDRAAPSTSPPWPRWSRSAPASGWPSTATGPPPAAAAAPTCWRRSGWPSPCRPTGSRPPSAR